MIHLILLRHGESEINVRNRSGRLFCGQTDTPLTDLGRRQAVEAGRLLAARGDLTIRYAISSALQRARETMALVLGELPPDIVRLPAEADLNERGLGLFEGRSQEDVFAEYPAYATDERLKQFAHHFEQKAPGGENLAEVTARAWPVIAALCDLEGDVLVVGHSTTLRCVRGRALRLSQAEVMAQRLPNAVPVTLRHLGDGRFEAVDQLPTG